MTDAGYPYITRYTQQERNGTMQPQSEPLPFGHPDDKGEPNEPQAYHPDDRMNTTDRVLEETTAITQSSPMAGLRHRKPRDVDTSLDLSTLSGRMALANAMGPQALSLFDTPSIAMVMTGYVCYRDTVVNDETGEVSEVVRSVILGADGRNLMTTSSHMPSRLLAIRDLVTDDELRHGIAVVAEVKKGRRKRDYHDLRIVEPDKTA